MKTIGEYSTHLPHTIGRQTSIEKAREMMEQNKCHHLPVLDGGKLVGVLSSTDLARAHDESAHVSDIMTDEPLVVNPEDGVKDVVGRMLKNSYGSAIISAKGDSPWAIFTSIDAMKLLHEMLP
ncbi:MAG: CBS domain-containing protein [Bdellovibrionaceae bacterium]|nr:CBS domain-containing protein [Bdellovibrionales bacterium]MCB9085044.1 CBS domain-containing protein [Pseudobdellovibrionaceae bacterium]